MIERIRTILSAPGAVQDMDQPALRLHPLKGDYQGYWAVAVRASRRIIFRFEVGRAMDIDLPDDH